MSEGTAEGWDNTYSTMRLHAGKRTGGPGQLDNRAGPSGGGGAGDLGEAKAKGKVRGCSGPSEFLDMDRGLGWVYVTINEEMPNLEMYRWKLNRIRFLFLFIKKGCHHIMTF